MKRNFWLFLIFYSLSNFCLTFSQTPDNLILQANQAYQKGSYALCISLLDSLHHQKMGAASTFYNEGNAYYQFKNYPQAILNYERALRLENGNKDILNNLNLANKQLTDNINPIPELFIFRWWKSLACLFSPTFWAIFALLFLGIGLFFAVSYRLSPRKNKMRMLILFLFLAIIGRFAYMSSYDVLYLNRFAIILQNEAQLKAKPGEESATVRKITAGIKVEIKEELGDWANVKLPNGELGWLALKNMEKIYEETPL
ncbi:MAG: SH3 domain-containing protein [Bacteroidia bacterium]